MDYDLGLLLPVIEALDLSVALDVGHFARDGRDLGRALARLLERTRIVQWHGTDPEDRDHRSLRHYPPDAARELLDALAKVNYDGVLTLEVFREADLEESLILTQAWLTERGAGPTAPMLREKA